jgi:predicted enzyme related to lactoylglutathione lyase
MSETILGNQGWLDMTVPDADGVRDFYADVCGWTAEPTDMGGYSDYTMLDSAGGPVGGICHTRGVNADMPPGWIPYFTVSSVKDAVAAATAKGGAVALGPKEAGGSQMAVVRDPSGAHFAVWQV